MASSSVSHIMDLIKDLLILIQFAIVQGGLEVLLIHPEPFMPTVRQS